MLVFMEDAAEAVASSDVQAGYLVRVCDRGGQCAQWPGVGDALVRAVGVVELLELAQGVQEVVLAGNYVRAGHAACWYSWRMPPRRSRLGMSRLVAGSSGSGGALCVRIR